MKKKLMHDLFKAYYDARRHKRGSMSAIAFETNYESKLLQLGQELMDGTYKIGKSICFISFKPLQREIFAADFRDRIVHHFIFNCINPVFEKSFINDSYSCRIGKGTLYGIKRLDHFIRSCSKNYSEDCHVLKLDIRGYFMSINKNILYEKIEQKLKKSNGLCRFDSAWLLLLIHQVIFHNPTEDCVVKGKREDWRGLPKSKSLFGAGCERGLPIGNLTSQLFGNVYLDELDQFAKHKLKCRYYGRYVDDIVIVHSDKEYLKSAIPAIGRFLHCALRLELHPKKICLQHFQKGVPFLGVILKPYRMYVRNKTKGNFYDAVRFWNNFSAKNPAHFSAENRKKCIAVVSSYLGMMSHFNTYKLRKKILTESLSPFCQSFFNIPKALGGSASK